MEEKGNEEKPVIDWLQVFVCNGWDKAILDNIINSDSLEIVHRIEEL